MDAVNWRELEGAVGLEDLPAFHRAFLAARGVADPQALPLRRVQQAVERELNRLVSSGLAWRDGEAVWVNLPALDGLGWPALPGLLEGLPRRHREDAGPPG